MYEQWESKYNWNTYFTISTVHDFDTAFTQSTNIIEAIDRCAIFAS